MRLLVDLALFAIVSALHVRAQGSLKEEQDCKSFNQIAKNIEALSKPYKLTDDCTTFKNCSGLHCSGSAFQKSFRVSMGIQHCQNPVKLWLHLAVPSMGINEWRLLKDEEKVDLITDMSAPLLPLPVSVSVVPKLKVKNNNITMGGRVCFKLLLEQCRTMADISLPISKKICAINGTSPHSNPTEEPKMKSQTMETSKAKKPTTGQPPLTTKMNPVTSLHSKHPVRSKPHDIRSSVDSAQTARSKEHKTHTLPYSSRHHQSGQSNTGKRKHSKAGGGLSTGTKVALVTSVLLAALLILGVVAYWRKLRKRRPAYYNDINVNREDEDPFFDSHLVL